MRVTIACEEEHRNSVGNRESLDAEEENMQKRFKQRHLRRRKAGTFLGEPIVNPLGHLSARYPFPARLNSHYMAKLKTSNNWTAFSKGTIRMK